MSTAVRCGLYDALVNVGAGRTAAVGLAGHSGSGKSTLANGLVTQLGGSVIAFGDAVRWSAADRGLDPSDRLTLMDLGHELAMTDPVGLCDRVLAQVEAPATLLIFDGIRHLRVLEELRDRFGIFHLVFLKATDELIRGRLDGAVDPTAHRSERDIPHLEQEADLVLDACRPAHELVRTVVATIPGLDSLWSCRG